jgi:hypothetical protein
VAPAGSRGLGVADPPRARGHPSGGCISSAVPPSILGKPFREGGWKESCADGGVS